MNVRKKERTGYYCPTERNSFFFHFPKHKCSIGPVNTYPTDTNNTSIVMRIKYGNTSFLFTGDAEREEEHDILNAGYELNSTVLKVGHHGNESSTSYPFLRAVMPQYAIISVGADNKYGHPTEETLSKLRDADVTVYRTDLDGMVHCWSDGENVYFETEKNSEQTVVEKYDYVLNKKTHKFHKPDCSKVDYISEHN